METANITYQDKAGDIKVKIDYSKCIACGRCVTACKHKARYFTDDTGRFFDDLFGGIAISLIAAPSIKTNIPEYKKLFTYLKQLGVNKIYDVSLGADICVWVHIRYLEKNGSPIITQPCPVIVSYCEMYRHDLLKRLSPVHSPMGCASVYMKEYRGIGDRIAAVSPCVAKTNEFVDTKLSEYNITFASMLAYLAENGVALPDEETDFDHDESGLGVLFPMPGGLKENIEYFMGTKLHISTAEGFDVYEKLNKYAQTPEEFLPEIYDVLNCVEGCNMGSAYARNRSVFEIEKTMDASRKKAAAERKRAHYEAVYKAYDDALDFSHFIREYQPIDAPFPQITDADIEKAFVLLGKTDYERQNIDCSACGSETCRQMARKIALNVNIPANCIFKSKEDAKAEHEENLLTHLQLTKMEKTREADERMRVMLNTTPFGAYILDENMNVVEYNQAIAGLLKLTDKQEFIERFYDFSPELQPDGRSSKETAARYLRKAFKEKRQFFEWTFRALDGELIPCEVNLALLDYKDGEFAAAYVRDLREQKRMEAKLAEEYEKSKAASHWYKSILDAIPLPINVTDANMNWTFVNRAVEDFLGMKYEDMRGKPCSNWNAHICGTEDCGVIRAKRGLKRTFFTHEESSYQVDVEILKDLKGETSGYVEIVQDITKVETMARTQAEAESKAKSMFLASMSHEIRTPINAIVGMTAIGKNAADINRKDYALNKIEDASSHLLGVVNDILDMSKIEADKLELSPVEFNLNRMIQKVITVINFRVEEKRQRFTVETDSKLPHFIIGDDQRLTQVIVNLLSNAVKFTPEEGEIHLGITMESENDGLCELRIEVTDTGIGMSAEQREKLFNAFTQADSGISRQYGGTGLGLAISKRIVELMGGDISAESELGHGTRFTVTVKARRGTKGSSSLLADDVSWENVRVLVVDDAVETREQLSDLFDSLNIKCDFAADGFEACEMLEEHGQYDIYFIDWRMPGMDGIELTKRIRARKGDEPSMAIMITSADWDIIKDDALKAGVNKYLIKPLSSTTVIDCVNECLNYGQHRVIDAPDITGGIFEGKRLLLAEDMEINREIIISLLENTGLIIDCAQNGTEALEMVQAAPDNYDIVFMDVQMPGMDGLESTRRIRALPDSRCAELPIIAMTANVFKEDIENCIAAGMNGHLGKPINIDEVIHQLRQYL